MICQTYWSQKVKRSGKKNPFKSIFLKKSVPDIFFRLVKSKEYMY